MLAPLTQRGKVLKTGKVITVCISSQPNIPKYVQEEIEVGEYGFVGDIHAGPTRISRRTGKPKFNERQVSIVAQEDLDFLSAELWIALKPGDLGENITTQGLGSLLSLVPGMCLFIGKYVILEVTEQNDPCQNINQYHRLLVKTSYQTRRRGVLAIVRTGTGSKIRPGDKIFLCS